MAAAPRVTVYFFTKYDILSDQTIRSKRPATLEAIRLAFGQPLMETAEEISAYDLDEDGFRRRDYSVASSDMPSSREPDSN